MTQIALFLPLFLILLFSSIAMALVSGIQNQILDVTGNFSNQFPLSVQFIFSSLQFPLCYSCCFGRAVVACSKLKDTELFSRQDPYVCIEYANSKFRTRTCTGWCFFFLYLLAIDFGRKFLLGGSSSISYWSESRVCAEKSLIWNPDGSRNPTFQEKFQIPLVEGLREMNVTVWNSNTIRTDDFIGSGRFDLIILSFLCF